MFGHPKLDLPTADRDIYQWAKRKALAIAGGQRASGVHFPSRQRFVGRGERFGVADTGRLSDFRVLHSMLLRRPNFRRNEVAPFRRILLLHDLRDTGLSRETARLGAVVILLGTVLSSMPGTQVSLTSFGTSAPKGQCDLPIDGAVRLLRGYAQQALSAGDGEKLSKRAQAGRLRRALASAADSHVVIVTHGIEPELLANTAFPLGATIVLVEPPRGGPCDPRGATGVRPLLGGLDLQTGDEKYRKECTQLRRMRIQSVVVDASGKPMTALGAVL
jgi:hypothetical protein